MKKSNIKIRKLRSGFTLMELLVSIVIFMSFLGIVSQSYLNIVTTQRQANEIRKMYSDVRGFVDFLAEEVRLSEIDYGCYETSSSIILPKGGFGLSSSVFKTECPETNAIIAGGRTSVLLLASKNGLEKTAVKVEQDKENPDRFIVKVKKIIKFGNVWEPAPGFEEGYAEVLSEGVKVKNLSFAIFPDVNPYSDDYEIFTDNTTQFQPKVTVFLSIANPDESRTEFSYDFQTTISSRVYSRSK